MACMAGLCGRETWLFFMGSLPSPTFAIRSANEEKEEPARGFCYLIQRAGVFFWGGFLSPFCPP